MDLSKILSIAGKPGLFKVVAQTNNGVVVESLIDGKRITAFASDQMSSLEEISVFTVDEDISLKIIFKSVFDKMEGKAAINHKSDTKELKAFFEDVVPDYDKERVYTSDIKKVIQWYNLLLNNELMNFDEESASDESSTDENETSENK